MIGYPLAPVVAFLRARGGALSILDGAPLYYSNCPIPTPMQPVPAEQLETWSGEPIRVLGSEHHAMLYLGTDDLCPAAEGWVKRVLALNTSEPTTHLNPWTGNAVTIMRDDRLIARWTWHTKCPTWRSFRERFLIGPPPPTPAARVAAVLDFELKRSAS